MTAPTKRQTHPWPWWRRLWREIVWGLDLDDGTGDGAPSLTKWLALVFGVTAAIAIFFNLTVTGMHVTLAIVAISAAFGRSMWRHFLASKSFTATASDVTTRTEQRIRQEIVTRREQGGEDGSEPTP